MAKIIIPTPLRKFASNEASIETKGDTVKESVEDLLAQFPDLKKHLMDDKGEIRRYIRIYVGDEDIDALNSVNTSVSVDSLISIIPAIAGGLG